MRNGPTASPLDGVVPNWVPRPAVHYLAHIEAGLPIRKLARDAGCHASTVLRQIRSFESRREDPLVDAALCRLGRSLPARDAGSYRKETPMAAQSEIPPVDTTLTEEDFRREGARVLRRLVEPGALLVVAANMDKAVVVRDREGAEPTRTGVVDKEVAEAIALKGWIQCTQSGRITRYTVSPAGRDALGRLMADAENAALGFAEMPATFQGQGALLPTPDADNANAPSKRKRYAATESPVLVLARRKDKTGAPFLSDELVRAGERLREDFELAQMNMRGEQNWDAYVTGMDASAPLQAGDVTQAEAEARDRVAGALRDLGPGLGDVALHCCCHLGGLELAEKNMGWSARSGKVVLRIALQRLSRHYRELGDAGQMIG